EEPSVGTITISEPTVNGQLAGSAPGPSVVTGTDATVEVTVTNDGDAPVDDLAGSSSVGDLSCETAALDPGTSTSCSFATPAEQGPQEINIQLVGVSNDTDL